MYIISQIMFDHIPLQKPSEYKNKKTNSKFIAMNVQEKKTHFDKTALKYGLQKSTDTNCYSVTKVTLERVFLMPINNNS